MGQVQNVGKPATLATTNYQPAVNAATTAATGSLNASAGTQQQQAQLASQLLAQSNGAGPNLAAAQLAQTSGQLQRQQAGAAASQTGINPGLAARQNSEQGAQMQQQAAGQAATQRMQQQLGSESLAGQTLGQNAQTQIQQQGANTQAAGVAGQLQNQQNATNVQNQLGAQGISAQAQEANINETNQIVGGILGVGGTALTAAGLAHGGEVPPDFAMARHMLRGGPVPGHAPVAGDSRRNDIVPAMLSPGEGVIPRSIMQSPDAELEAAKFIHKLKKAHGGEAEAPRDLLSRIAALEAQVKGMRKGVRR